MNTLLSDFFDSLHDAVVIVDWKGNVQHANPTGLRVFDVQPGQPFPIPRVIQSIKDIVDGFARSPVKVAVAGGGSPAEADYALVMPLSPSGPYVVTLQNLQEKAAYEQARNNLFGYVHADLAVPLMRMSRQLDGLARDKGNPEIERLAAEAEELAGRLEQICLLSDLFQEAPLIDEERLPLPQMIDALLNAMAPKFQARRIEVYLSGMDDELPPVYGSRVWLERALKELLDNVAKHALVETKLELSLRCTGTHVIVGLRNHGLFATKALRSGQLFVPFNQATAARKPDHPGRKSPGLGLPLVKRVLALHGGHLNISENEEDGIVEFTLEIATGAPARDQHALDIVQAQRYAHDMAAMMERMSAARGAA